MKRILSAILCVMLCLAVSTTAFAAPVPQKVLDAKKGVVKVFSLNNDVVAYGTGFVVSNSDEGCIIITNHHVVEDMQEFEMYFDGKGPVKLKLIATSVAQDLCALKVDTKISGLKVLKLEEKEIRIGDEVYALGYPGGADDLTQDNNITLEQMTLTNGIVSAIQGAAIVGDRSKKVKMIQSNADINKGNSGGPMLNARGNVIGVNTLGPPNTQGIFGSVHVDELRLFINKNVPIKTPESPIMLIALIVAGVLIAVLIIVIIVIIKHKGSHTKAIKECENNKPEQLSMDYNSAVPVEQNEKAKAVPRAKKRWKILIILPIIAVAIGVTAFVIIGKNERTKAIDAVNDALAFENYDLIIQTLEEKPWLENAIEPNIKKYSEAMLLVQDFDITAAAEIFKELGDYKNSAEMYERSSSYINAAKMSTSEAIRVYFELENFADSYEKFIGLLDEVYNEAKQLFIDCGYNQAKKLLQIIPLNYAEDVKQMNDIILAVDKINAAQDNNDFESELVYVYVACILADEYGFKEFYSYVERGCLEAYIYGDWLTSNGQHSFGYDQNTGEFRGNIVSKRVEFRKYSGLSYLSDSSMYFEIISADSMRIYYNGKIYELYRNN